MEYLISSGIGAMLVLYIVIIVQCLRHPEW